MKDESANINIFFTVIKLFSFRKFLMQTAITGAFPIYFTVTDLLARLNTFYQNVVYAFFVNFSFDRLLDGLTKKEM